MPSRRALAQCSPSTLHPTCADEQTCLLRAVPMSSVIAASASQASRRAALLFGARVPPALPLVSNRIMEHSAGLPHCYQPSSKLSSRGVPALRPRRKLGWCAGGRGLTCEGHRACHHARRTQPSTARARPAFGGHSTCGSSTQSSHVEPSSSMNAW